MREEEQSLQERNSSVKVSVEELEELLGPEDVDVDFRRWSRWDKYKKSAMETRFVSFCK